jgi:hypothetical protein
MTSDIETNTDTDTKTHWRDVWVWGGPGFSGPVEYAEELAKHWRAGNNYVNWTGFAEWPDSQDFRDGCRVAYTRERLATLAQRYGWTLDENGNICGDINARKILARNWSGTKWSDLRLYSTFEEGLECDDYDRPRMFADAMADYRIGRGLDQWFFAEPHWGDDDDHMVDGVALCDFGPSPDDIDWSGFDEWLAEEGYLLEILRRELPILRAEVKSLREQLAAASTAAHQWPMHPVASKEIISMADEIIRCGKLLSVDVAR